MRIGFLAGSLAVDWVIIWAVGASIKFGCTEGVDPGAASCGGIDTMVSLALIAYLLVVLSVWMRGLTIGKSVASSAIAVVVISLIQVLLSPV